MELHSAEPQAAPSQELPPDAHVFLQLNELNGRLEHLTRALVEDKPIGLEVNKVLHVTDQEQEVSFWAVSYTMYNDGTGSVYTQDKGTGTFAKDSTRNPPLRMNEPQVVNFGRRTNVNFLIACASGETATVRIRGHE